MTIKNSISTILKNYDFIAAAFIFGSFGTDEFMDDSDIDIAILLNKDVDYMKLLEIEELLELELNIKTDLNSINELPKHIQMQIIIRNDCIYISDEECFDTYLDNLNYWYKTEFPFWFKLMSERSSV